MEENKLDYGSVQIHKKVLEDICVATINEIEGVSLITEDLWGRLFKLLGRKNYAGIDVFIDKDNQVNIEVKVNVRYGLKLPLVAQQVQNTIREAIEKIAEVDLRDINVNIQSMERGEA